MWENLSRVLAIFQLKRQPFYIILHVIFAFNNLNFKPFSWGLQDYLFWEFITIIYLKLFNIQR